MVCPCQRTLIHLTWKNMPVFLLKEETPLLICKPQDTQPLPPPFLQYMRPESREPFLE